MEWRTAKGDGEGKGRIGKRYAVVSALLYALCALLACAAVLRSSSGGRAIAALEDMLCCEGCCAATASIASAIADRDDMGRTSRSSGLEIDYTAGGHRVSQHMESALSEIDSLADHVKNGLPKFLTESAAQREADLMSHKFAHEDDGHGLKDSQPEQLAETSSSSSSAVLVDPYEKQEQEQLAREAVKAKANAAAAKQKALLQLTMDKHKSKNENDIVQKGVEAKRISESVNRLEHNSAAKTTQTKDGHQAQMNVVGSFRSLSDISGDKSASLPSSQLSAKVASGDDDGFQPITSTGWADVVRAKAVVAQISKKKVDANDAKDEAILHHLAMKDEEHEHESKDQPAFSPASVSTGGTHVTGKSERAVEATRRLDNQRTAKMTATEKEAKSGSSKTHENSNEQQLNAVESRIKNIISSQTGGASRHPTYFKHFDSAEAKAAAAARLAAFHQQARATLAPSSTSSIHSPPQGSSQVQLQSRVYKAHGAGGVMHVKAASTILLPIAAGGAQGYGHGTREPAQASLEVVKSVGGGGHRAVLQAQHSARGHTGGETIELREVQGGMLAGSGVALKEEEMLYGTHRDLDERGAQALKHSSLIGLGL